MMGYWKDPDFDAGGSAFYYVRVIEVPIPGWHVFDEKYYGVKGTEEAALKTTERTYISPVW
jgi:hypothetical protein